MGDTPENGGKRIFKKEKELIQKLVSVLFLCKNVKKLLKYIQKWFKIDTKWWKVVRSG